MAGRAGVLALLSATLLGACTSGGAPEGYDRVEDGWLRVDVPEGWTDTGALNDRWSRSWQDAEGEQGAVQLAAVPAWGTAGSDAASGQLVAEAQVGGYPGFQVENQDWPDLEADTQRWRIDFTYESEDGEPLQGVWWVASDKETSKTVAVQLTGEHLDEEVVTAIGESIAVIDTDATPSGQPSAQAG
ncbi:hypothetical protein DNL40_14755 [Xylanimonas oleitrophica]|uniref:DUF4245 domain-containing protein n=1 Tax=Xylanimonas oleitrophica TaxID=2607479 RepID=A0A2W5XQM5_9MICO|nr:hypothetical protein DNL40_14755 [Xylanimonas oleitrophica]